MFFALSVAACGKPLWEPTPPATRLAVNDPNRAYVGQWQLDFSLDSLLSPLTGPAERAAWQRPSGAPESIVGTLKVSDSFVGRDRRYLATELQADFSPLLDRGMSCFRPGPGALEIVTDRNGTVLGFTAGAFDCGFSGRISGAGDSLVGTWTEWSIAGPIASGPFRMRRE